MTHETLQSSYKHQHAIKLPINHVPKAAAKHLMRFNCCCLSVGTKKGYGVRKRRNCKNIIQRPIVGSNIRQLNRRFPSHITKSSRLLKNDLQPITKSTTNEIKDIQTSNKLARSKTARKLYGVLEADDSFHGISAMDRKCKSSVHIARTSKTVNGENNIIQNFGSPVLSDKLTIGFRPNTQNEESQSASENIENPSDDDDASTDYFNLEINVTLRKRKASDMVGLTLCYAFLKGIVRIYVQEVEPKTAADISGRIFPGDQIKTVNGIVLNSRMQAISLFKNGMKFHLCIIRTPYAAISRCLFSTKMFSLSGDAIESNRASTSKSLQNSSDRTVKSQLMSNPKTCNGLSIFYEQPYRKENKNNMATEWSNSTATCFYLASSQYNLLGNLSSSTVDLFTDFNRNRIPHMSSWTSNDQKSNTPRSHGTDGNAAATAAVGMRIKRKHTSMSILKLQALKARERKINEERSVTTEDEYMSDVKLGKYWTKTQRKIHLAKSKKNQINRNITFSRTS
ncbi:hypothetical protein ACOME3_009498 [Neoechinorhynchus agilis]